MQVVDDLAVPLLLPSCVAHLNPLGADVADECRVVEELHIEPRVEGGFLLDIPFLGLSNVFDLLDDAIWCRDALLSGDNLRLTEVAVHRAQKRGEVYGWDAFIRFLKRNNVVAFDTVGFDGLIPYQLCPYIKWHPKKHLWELKMGGTRKGESGCFVAYFKLWELASAIAVRDRLRGGSDREFTIANARVAAKRDHALGLLRFKI